VDTITTDAFICGGFTPIACESSNSDRPGDRETSFVFRVKNGHDIRVLDGCHANRNNDPKRNWTYSNTTGFDATKGLTGQQNFMVKEIKFFSIRDSSKSS
jgi:hypothetical protein